MGGGEVAGGVCCAVAVVEVVACFRLFAGVSDVVAWEVSVAVTEAGAWFGGRWDDGFVYMGVGSLCMHVLRFIGHPGRHQGLY